MPLGVPLHSLSPPTDPSKTPATTTPATTGCSAKAEPLTNSDFIDKSTTLGGCGCGCWACPIRGWVGFVGSTENSLRTAVHPSDHLEVAAFSRALIGKLVLFSLRGVMNSELSDAPPNHRSAQGHRVL
eukprot:COSAG02_NODE_4942_length_4806_cov_2.678989_1_plen_128_part_00